MRIFLLWRYVGEAVAAPDAQRVASGLRSVFLPIVGAAPSARILHTSGATLVSLEWPTRGWKPPFFQEDDRTWALAGDYPLNGRAALAASGVAFGEHDFLPSLGRKLQEDPRPVLKELAPPFSLIWSSPETGDVLLQNDGLGQSQLFEYEDGPLWAVSNKITAFRALGVELKPDPEQWAVRATLGWFPLDTTGYGKTRFVRPATQIRIDAGGVRRAEFDVLSEWVCPAQLSREQGLELARESLLSHVKGCLPLWENPEVGLTGGWDSRAVASTLRVIGADFRAGVRGVAGRHDVTIARELARLGGFDLAVHAAGGLPPDSVAGCRRGISLALGWQGGHAAAHRHKTFLAGGALLKPRRVSVTGQHGEIGRRERALFSDERGREILAARLSPSAYEAEVKRELVADMPPFLRPSLRDGVRRAILAAYHQADRYGLTGMGRVDFFCLHEFTRRKGAAVHAWQPRLVVAPFLNPGFIRAVFGYTDRTDPNSFHRHIIGANAPDWADVPYYEDLEMGRTASPGTTDLSTPHWACPTGRENYDGSQYWQTVGRPLIDEALAHGGFWTDVFDPDLAARLWTANPDLLAILDLLPRAI